MAKGLDVGTMNLVGSQLDHKKTVLRQQRNLFLELDADDVTGQMLAQANVLHMKLGSQYVIVGQDALNFATVMNADAKRPMRQGILARDEKQAIPMMKLIIERLLGPPDHADEVCFYSCPGPPVDGKRNILYHQKILAQVLKRLGYEAHVINEGLATVYADLRDHDFTGLGISFGAGMINVALSHLGVPLASFSVQRGGDWIDLQVSDATGLAKDKVTVAKESGFQLEDRSNYTQVHAALAIYYDDLMDYAVRHIENECRRVHVDEGVTVPCVITGGTSSPKGFVEAFEERLRAASLPFEVGEVRTPQNPLYSVTMGALVGAKVHEAEAALKAAAA